MAYVEPIGKYRLTKKERLKVEALFGEALENRDKQLFERTIQNDLGLKPGTLEYARCLRLWNASFASEK